MSAMRVSVVVSLLALGASIAWWVMREDERVPINEAASGPPVIERGERESAANVESANAGDPWAVKNKRAIRHLNAGELSAAVALFSECVVGDPTELVFRANLAEALARLAQEEYEAVETRALAIEHLTQAVELAPEREELAKLLKRWLAAEEVEGDFWTDSSLHFRLSYDGDREELLGGGYDLVLKTLEDAYSEYAVLFGVRPAEGEEGPIEVVLLQREEFNGLTGLGHWAGGAYDGRIRIPITDLASEERRLVSVLRHELVHAFIRSAGGRGVVGWLNEGLAEWLEEPAGAARDRAVKRSRERAAKAGLRSLDELGGSLAALGSVEEIRGAYSQSLALIAWIAHWYGERVLFEMVAGCREGTSVEQSFEAQTRVQLAQALKDLELDLSR